jgi:hypothetical protein
MDRKRACTEVSHRRDMKFCESSPSTGRDVSLLVISRPDAKNGRQLSLPVTRVAKRYELRAARPSRCEESFRW